MYSRSIRPLALSIIPLMALAALGCQASVSDLERKKATSSAIDNNANGNGNNGTPQAFASLKTDDPPVPAEINIEPANGTLFNATTTDLAITFTGFTDKAAQTIEIQVLSQPSAPLAEANWVTIATTQTATTPTTFNDPAPIFRYSVSATPAPTTNADRWQQGGLLRYRVVILNPNGKLTAAPFFDSTSGRCIAALGVKSWKDTLAACKSPFSPDLGTPTAGQTHAAALVSPTPEPRDGFVPPPYLSRKGFITPEDTNAYYDAINAPQTLADFQNRFGFAQQQDTSAVYYNLGDLGIGREMHCAAFNGNGVPGLACYVRNYGVDANHQASFSGDPASALNDAVQGTNSFATVAMVKFGADFAPALGNDVQFFVYNAQGAILNQAQLDSTGQNKAIPNNCTNCHGGSYDNNARTLKGASFLPFDPESFLFSDVPSFTYAAQEDQFRQLNVMVRNAGTPPSTVQFVNGLYDNKADTAGTKANLDWIPTGWATTEEAKTTYREVYKPFCRTCHTSQTGDYAFIRIEDFKKENNKLAESVCSTTEMPVAEATLGLFWRSPARAYFANSLGLATACAPKGK